MRVKPGTVLILIAVSLSILFTNCGGKGFEVISAPVKVEDPPSDLDDPLLDYAWHLSNKGQSVFASSPSVAGNDLNLQNTWTANIYGEGVRILVSDDGIESGHEDLNQNYLFGNLSKNYKLASPFVANTAEPLVAADNHGTAVAGLIAAVGWNHRGTRGVAPKAKIVSANFMSDTVSRTFDRLVDQVSGNFDVYNQSWGAAQDSLDETNADYKAQLLYGVTNYRSGKGAIYVKAAGNAYLLEVERQGNEIELGNANFDSTNTTPYTINVGALAATAIAASYSSPGANLWVSAPGGEDGVESPAMITSDRSGCSSGYSLSAALSSLGFEKGSNSNNRFCRYTATFNGTSSATPVTAGSVALILQANPNLTWRDVKYILASTATKIHGSIPAFENELYSKGGRTDRKSPTGYTYEQAWITNGAGFNFHNWYGFGRVNVDAAVTAAKTYTSTLGTYTETGWNASHKRSSLSVAIADNTYSGSDTDTMTVATNLKIEAVQLRLKVTHANIGQLAVELISPSGTKSILVNMNNSLDGIANFSNETLLSNAFYQESSAGTWKIRVIDGRTGTTGTLTEWSLNFIGG